MSGAIFGLELAALAALALVAVAAAAQLLGALLPAAWPAARRADLLALLALAPPAAAIWVLAALLSPSLGAALWRGVDHCLTHSHHGHLCPWHPGPGSAMLAGLGLLAALRGLAHGGASLRSAARRLRLRRALRDLAVEVPWASDVCVLPSRALVCGVGLGLTSKILLSSALAEALSPAQLQLVLSHERAHLRRRDELLQELLLLVGCLAPGGASLLRRWRAAAEEAADDEATRGGSGWVLAEALLRAAQLSQGPSPGLALLQEGLERRVERLLRGAPAAAPARWAPLSAALGLLGTLALVCLGEPVHHGLETLRHHISLP